MTRGDLIGTLSALAVLAAGDLARATPDLDDAILPAGAEAGMLLRVDQLPEAVRARRLSFDVSPAGQPLLLAGELFLPLANRTTPAGVPFRIAGASPVDGFAYMQDGALLLVVGDRLGIATARGFSSVAALPSSGMEVAAAGPDQAYLWGGAGAQSANLYLYRKGGAVAHLVRASAPITAIAGSGDVTFFAVGTTVLRLERGRSPSLVKELTQEVTSLALISPSRVFYSTASGVGFLDADGRDFPFVRGSGATLRVQGDTLYLLFAKDGLMRVAPVTAFNDLAAAVDKAQVR